jgi:hypothetical protein
VRRSSSFSQQFSRFRSWAPLRAREQLIFILAPSRFLLQFALPRAACMPVHTIQVPALVLRAGLGLVFPLRAESPGRSYFSCRQLLISMPKILSCSRCQFLISLHPPMILHSQWWTFSFPLIGPGARPGSVRRLRQEANLRLLVILTW